MSDDRNISPADFPSPANLEQALTANREEDIARLYLGLTLAARAIANAV